LAEGTEAMLTIQGQKPQDTPMNVTVRMPDAVASRLAPRGGHLAREALRRAYWAKAT
jgi:hypothetical protein